MSVCDLTASLLLFRLFKVVSPESPLEDSSEDYGHTAEYLGTLPGSTEQYALDDDTRCEIHTFNQIFYVCLNPARGSVWLSHLTILTA